MTSIKCLLQVFVIMTSRGVSFVPTHPSFQGSRHRGAEQNGTWHSDGVDSTKGEEQKATLRMLGNKHEANQGAVVDLMLEKCDWETCNACVLVRDRTPKWGWGKKTWEDVHVPLDALPLPGASMGT